MDRSTENGRAVIVWSSPAPISSSPPPLLLTSPPLPPFLCVLQLAGRLLGLSVRHGTPLGVVLPPAVWGLLQGRTPTWQDYCGDDHTFKASMQKVGHCTVGEGHWPLAVWVSFSVPMGMGLCGCVRLGLYVYINVSMWNSVSLMSDLGAQGSQ